MKKNAYIMFTDIKGFSKLSKEENLIFFNDVLKDLANKINQYKNDCLVWNTWGDALVAITEDSEVIKSLLFDYREFFRSYDFSNKNIRKLQPRIAAHFGEFNIFNDMLLNKKNAIGENINLTARIEPITLPGDIFVTEDFKFNIEKNQNDLKFQFLGELPLAKNFGNYNLYRLLRSDEREHKIIELTKQYIDTYPKRKKLSSNDLRELESLRKSLNPDDLKKRVDLSNKNLEYKFQVAKLYNDFGLYDEAYELLNNIENSTERFGSVDVNVYKYDKEFLKLMTNVLTRLGKYKEASIYITGVLNNEIDSDSLSMLAAQYKRMAIFDENGEFREETNKDLLEYSLKLYLEALRLNIDDYYPAINVAYIYKFLGENGKAHKLAYYVQENFQGDDWWFNVTLIETDLILEDFNGLDKKFGDLIEKYNPIYFEKRAVLEQVKIYQRFIENNEIIEKVIEILR